MPTLPYSGLVYVNPFDPAYTDLWLPPYNDLHISHDAYLAREMVSLTIAFPVDSFVYGIVNNIRFPGTVKSARLWTDAGTLTAAIKIGSTNITSLDAISVSATPATTTATGSNTLVAANNLNIVCSSVSGVNLLYVSVWIDRTGAGTA